MPEKEVSWVFFKAPGLYNIFHFMYIDILDKSTLRDSAELVE